MKCNVQRLSRARAAREDRTRRNMRSKTIGRSVADARRVRAMRATRRAASRRRYRFALFAARQGNR